MLTMSACRSFLGFAALACIPSLAHPGEPKPGGVPPSPFHLTKSAAGANPLVSMDFFADPRNPETAKIAGMLKTYEADGEVTIIVHPVSHPGDEPSEMVVRSSCAAGKQGNAYEFLSALLRYQGVLDLERCQGVAKVQGLDAAKFEKDFHSSECDSQVRAALAVGRRLDPDSVLMINGERSFPEDSSHLELLVSQGKATAKDSRVTKALYWNAWPALPDSPASKPVVSLGKEKDFALFLDLATIAYRGASGGKANPPLLDLLQAWSQGSDKRQLEILAIPDSDFFESKPGFATMELDPAILRDRLALPVPQKDPFDLIAQGKDTFSLRRMRFDMRTKKRAGLGSIAISVWKRSGLSLTPVDEFQVSVCVDERGKRCSVKPVAAVGLKGTDALRSSTVGSEPAASLHFLMEGGHKVLGIFWQKGMPLSSSVVWRLAASDAMLREALQQREADFQREKEDELKLAGSRLFNLFFPPGAPEARGAFRKFLLKNPIVAGGPASAVPALFVRLLQDVDDSPMLLPLGLMAPPREPGDPADPDFVAKRLRVETPLPVAQSGSDQCSKLLIVMPKENVSGELVNAVQELAMGAERFGRVGEWRDAQVPNLPTIEILREFLRGKAGAMKEPIGLVVLSHQENNKLYFNNPTESGVVPEDVLVNFPRGSLGLLVGCNTGGIGAQRLAQQFNRQGMGALVSTVASIRGNLGGSYLDCFAKQIDAHRGSLYTLGEAHWDATQCLAKRRHGVFGARSFLFSLTGNSGLRICAP